MALFSSRKTFRFANKTCLVTGGSRGLGLLLARRLCDAGAKVAICARDEVELARAQRDLTSVDADVLAVRADITRREEAAAFVHEARQRFGDIHCLINNAGVIQVGPVETMTDQDFIQSLQTHFWAPYFMITEALPDLLKHPGIARVVNISSIGGRIAAPHLLPYCTGKFALEGFSEGLRAELADRGVTVTTVAPGLMRTGSALRAIIKGDKEKEFAWFLAADSMPVLSMDADKAADSILAAAARGDSELVLSLPAQLAILARAVFPEAVAWALARIARNLPKGDPLDTSSTLGAAITPSPRMERWSRVTRDVARRNNEVAG